MKLDSDYILFELNTGCVRGYLLFAINNLIICQNTTFIMPNLSIEFNILQAFGLVIKVVTQKKVINCT